MRALSDLPEITLDSDEYGIAWSFDTLPETITQFNQEVSSIHAGNSTLHKNLVRIIKTQQEWCYLQAVCRLCTSYLMKYAIIFDGNFLLCGQYRKPLAYDFAERFDQEMWKYQFNLGVFQKTSFMYD